MVYVIRLRTSLLKNLQESLIDIYDLYIKSLTLVHIKSKLNEMKLSVKYFQSILGQISLILPLQSNVKKILEINQQRKIKGR